jgi:hypothetical protein
LKRDNHPSKECLDRFGPFASESGALFALSKAVHWSESAFQIAT